MKTNVKKIILTGAISLLLAAAASADSVEVISTKGKVEVNRNDSWVPIKAGDKVSESEVISTGFQSEAKVKYKDSIMQLGAMSRITLSKLASGETKDVVDVYLNTGAVRSKVNHSDDKKVSYTVRNPVAVASVRGTDFISFDDGSIVCYSGAVVLTPAALFDSEPAAAEETAEETSEETENIADTTPDPADGESNAATPAEDIAPSSPKGGVIVLGGQQSVITTSGQAATPFETAVKEVKTAATTVSTQAASEAVSIGSSSTAAAEAAKEPQTPAATTGSLTITINWED